MTSCPCNPDKELSECCGPFLAGDIKPLTAEALMRSRYTAYVNGEFNYLLNTWHESRREAAPDFGALAGIRWNGLEIIHSEAGGPEDREGTVEFKVQYQEAGTSHIMHEKSRFIREEDQWFYLDGKIMPLRSSKTGRNEPCPCGSGKKYKKCCMK